MREPETQRRWGGGERKCKRRNERDRGGMDGRMDGQEDEREA